MTSSATVVEVKETGMIFQPESITAILEGRKTQTRRAVTMALAEGTTFAHEDGGGNWIFWTGAVAGDMAAFTKRAYPNGEGIACPYGRGGDRIYAKESVWAYSGSNTFHYSSDEQPPKDSVHFGFQWHPHQMPKKAARLWLEITNVRVERLQEISEADAIAEGCQGYSWQRHPTLGICTDDGELPSEEFQRAWDSINAKRGYSWASNPWVWVIEFKKLVS